MRQRLSVLVAFVLACSLAATAHAGARDHDGGFFLRLSAGPGFAGTSITLFGDDVEFSGPGGDINLAIGGMVSRNLALHGTIFGWSITDPEVRVNDIEAGSANADFSMGAVGGGLTYYFMPANLYLSGSLGFGTLTVESGNVEGSTDPGLAGEVTFGKEWWVGDKWGIGIAGGLGFHAIGEQEIDDSWSGVHGSLRFTATMN